MKTCFVVMGFGEKTDFQANPQRVLYLNRTFEDIIEPALKACHVECIRADKIIHSTIIDKPMYEQLLGADLVIADLSTANANALYELGVRHALRPHTTIVIAEQGFAFPFDLGHLMILRYQHLGKEIGFREVLRMQEELKKRIVSLLERPEVDSPVFVFLPELIAKVGKAAPPRAPEAPGSATSPSVAELMEDLKQAKKDVKAPADWLVVTTVLNRLKKLQPNDAYVIQQLALATYKSKQPDEVTALGDAKLELAALAPDTSCDAETVGLWGAIHKRLWEANDRVEDLSTAVRAYARGYFIKNDYYNGINFAFLLDARAKRQTGDEATGDRVFAKRIRAEVLALCDDALARSEATGDELFWLKATKVEALSGLRRTAEAAALLSELRGPGPGTDWRLTSLDEQLAKLAALTQ